MCFLIFFNHEFSAGFNQLLILINTISSIFPDLSLELYSSTQKNKKQLLVNHLKKLLFVYLSYLRFNCTKESSNSPCTYIYTNEARTAVHLIRTNCTNDVYAVIYRFLLIKTSSSVLSQYTSQLYSCAQSCGVSNKESR